MQALQGAEGTTEAIARKIQNGYGFSGMYYSLPGGVPPLHRAPISLGPIAVPATKAGTDNRISFKHHYDLNPAAGRPLTLSTGLVPPPQISASNIYAGQTACSSVAYPSFLYNSSWATRPGAISAVGPGVQVTAPRMNTGTPYVVDCNDRGGVPAGATACAISHAPGPTPQSVDNDNDMGAFITASTHIPRDAENGRHNRKAHAPRAMGENRTPRSIPRGMSQGQAQTPRSRAVQYEEDIHTLAARLLNEGACPVTVEVLRTKIFNQGVTAEALMAKFISREQSDSRVKRKYHLLLQHSSDGYACLLCPQDSPAKYKNPPDSIRHQLKDHFGLALICRCGW
jgi:hypothetical protein